MGDAVSKPMRAPAIDPIWFDRPVTEIQEIAGVHYEMARKADDPNQTWWWQLAAAMWSKEDRHKRGVE